MTQSQIFNYFIVSTLILAVTVAVWGLKNNTEEVASKFKSDYQESIPDNMKNRNISLRDVFDYRFSFYKETIISLKKIQIGMLALVIVSILILVFSSKTVKVPLVSVDIPSGVVYLFIYFGGIYLWANMGLTLNASVNARMSLHILLEELQTGSAQENIHYLHFIEHVLADSSFVDNWFSHYFNVFGRLFDSGGHRQSSTIIGYLGLYGVYAVWFGIFLGSLIISTIEYYKRKNVNGVMAVIMLTFLSAFCVFTVGAFLGKMGYSCFWMATIWFVCAITIFLWKIYGDKLILWNKRKEEKIQEIITR